MAQTTVLMMVKVTITHDAAVISDDEVGAAAMAELRAQVGAGNTNKLEVGDLTVDVNETSFDLVTIIPTAYDYN